MEEKTFYKSHGHSFASKEEAEEWDGRINEEEVKVHMELCCQFKHSLINPICTENEEEEFNNKIEAAKSDEEEKKSLKVIKKKCLSENLNLYLKKSF